MCTLALVHRKKLSLGICKATRSLVFVRTPITYIWFCITYSLPPDQTHRQLSSLRPILQLTCLKITFRKACIYGPILPSISVGARLVQQHISK